MTLKDPRPYVFYAHIQWLDDSTADPHLVLQNGPKTRFPPHLAANSVVTFKVGAVAVRNLRIDEEGVSFSARFQGQEFTVYAPLDCMLMIYSADGQVRIPLQQFQEVPQPQSQEAPRQAVPQSEMGPLTRESKPAKGKTELTLITGGTSDGTPRGKLTLVPKSPPSQSEPTEPECA